MSDRLQGPAHPLGPDAPRAASAHQPVTGAVPGPTAPDPAPPGDAARPGTGAVDGPALGRAAAAAGAGYATALAAASVVCLLVVAAGDVAGAFGAAGPFLLVGASLFAPFQLTADGLGGSFSLSLVPLTGTALVLAGVWFATARWAVAHPRDPVPGTHPRPAPDVRGEWLAVGVTAASLGLGAALLAALVRLNLELEDLFITTVPELGVGPSGALLGGTVVGAAGAILGRATAHGGWDPGRLGLPRMPLLTAAARAAAWHVLPSVVVLPAVLLLAGAATQDVGLGTSFLLLAPMVLNAVGLAVAVVWMPGVEFSMTLVGSETVTLFGDHTPGWAPVLLILPVLGAALAAGHLHLSRPAVTGRRWAGAWVSPVLYGVVALAGLALLGVRGSGGAAVPLVGAVSGSVSLAPSPWVLVAAPLWAVAVEALSRSAAAPWLVGVLPQRARTVLGAHRGRGVADRVLPPDGPPSVIGPPPAGVATAGGATGPTRTVPYPPVRRVDRRRLALLVGAAVALVALLVAGVAVRGWVNSTVYSPSLPVVAYLEALERGDAEAALALADPDVATADRTLLTNDVYAGVDSRPSAHQVQDVVVEGDLASVTVTYDQDGRKVTATYTVRRAGSELVLFDRWELVPPPVPALSYVDVLLPWDRVPEVAVNGVVLPAADLSAPGAGTVRVLPGRYDLRLVPGSEYLESSTVRATVLGDGTVVHGGDGYLDLGWTDGARNEVAVLAEGRFEACVASTSAVLEDCGFARWAHDGAGDMVDVSWEVVQRPAFTVETDHRGDLVVRVTGGEVLLRGVLPAEPDRLFGRDEPEAVERAYDVDYLERFTIGADGRFEGSVG